MIIAIDGPAGAGKSSVAKKVAKELALIYIDTGAMYRALTLKAIEQGISIKDEDKLEKLLLNSEIDLMPDSENDNLKVFIDKKEVTQEIRDPEISNAVSLLSTHKKVRALMVEKQRQIAYLKNNVIMDGRDIGTVVFPNADVKIFLTASVNERANRRLKELIEKGHQTDLETLIKEIKKRDKLDTERTNSPLRPADDAIIVDTTDFTYQEVIDKLLDISNKISKIKETEKDNFKNDPFSLYEL